MSMYQCPRATFNGPSDIDIMIFNNNEHHMSAIGYRPRRSVLLLVVVECHNINCRKAHRKLQTYGLVGEGWCSHRMDLPHQPLLQEHKIRQINVRGPRRRPRTAPRRPRKARAPRQQHQRSVTTHLYTYNSAVRISMRFMYISIIYVYIYIYILVYIYITYVYVYI